MRRPLKLVAVGGSVLVAVLAVALAVHYQLRLRLLVAEPVVVGFSKDAWIECLAESEIVGHIDAVQLRGIVVTDASGTFTRSNVHGSRESGQQVCGFLGISIVDVEAKRYYIPFRHVGGLRKAGNEHWFWTNPFAT
jgi:hypothetical protein